MPGASVLVVDDYEDSRELYGEYLRLAGYHVITAADGDAALRCALQQKCDVIVLPQMDGLAVLAGTVLPANAPVDLSYRPE